MATKKTPFQLYDAEREKQYEALLSDYKAKIEKARKPSAVYGKIKSVTNKDYQQILSDLAIHSCFILEVEDEMDEDKSKDFETVFNEKFTSLKEKNKSTLLNQLALLTATKEFICHLQNEEKNYLPKAQNEKQIERSTIQWKGEVELEFVQLIYALNKAKYLATEKNEIIDLVKQVAKAFNYELGSNWQSNLSDSINNRNSDYVPSILKKLKDNYKTYCDERISKNKENKPK